MNKKELEKGIFDDVSKRRKFHNFDELETVNSYNKLQNKPQKYTQKDSKIISINDKNKPENTTKKTYPSLTIAEQIRIASGYDQAVIKITSYGKTETSISSHFNYISRDYELPIEDQDGNLLTSKEESDMLIDEWKSIYFDDRKNTRHTVHMVFSTPPGTDRKLFKSFTKEFLYEEFNGKNDYVFVQHNDTEHPHIHAVICLRGIHGKKLDPKKTYLNNLRKRFASKCREHGVMLDASRRFERGLSGKSTKSSLVQMREKRNIVPSADKRLLEKIAESNFTDTFSSNLTRNESIRTQFYNSAKFLFDEHKKLGCPPDDKRILAAKLLLEYSKNMPNEQTRGQFLKNSLTNNKTRKEKNILEKTVYHDLDNSI